jgi:CBS domain-containing protein
MSTKRIVPDVIASKQTLSAAAATDTVRAAVKRMAERRIGAVLVMDGDQLSGIFTERDVMNRVVARDLDPDTTTLADVMTPNPITVAPETLAMDALQMMAARGFRHLPVVDAGGVVGILSVRDLYATIHRQLEEDIAEREAFMFGAGYG